MNDKIKPLGLLLSGIFIILLVGQFLYGNMSNPLGMAESIYREIDSGNLLVSIIIGAAALQIIAGFGKLVVTKKTHYGDASFASRALTKKIGLMDKQGVLLAKKGRAYLRTAQPLSTLVLAPPGTGKTSSVLIPTLLSCPNSIVAMDIKGELFETTSKFRQQFSNVLKLDPLDPRNSVKWNPLDRSVLPKDWNDIVIYVERIGHMQIPTPKSGDPYWTDEGRNLFVMFALYLIYKHGDTSPPAIRAFILSTPDIQGELLPTMLSEEDLPQRVIEEGNSMIGKAEKEFSGIFGALKSALNVYADERISEILSGCDFTWETFRKENTTLYFTITRSDLKRLAPIIRIMLDYIITNLTTVTPKKEDLSITILADEFPEYGRLDAVIKMPSISRSYRVNEIAAAQDYAQITEVYGRETLETMKSTFSYQVVFTQNNTDTAEQVSKKIGNYTRKKVSKSIGANGNVTKSISYEGHPLITAQEIMSMPSSQCLIIAQGYATNPINAKPCYWFKDKKLTKRASM